jgi:hypothetical protein
MAEGLREDAPSLEIIFADLCLSVTDSELLKSFIAQFEFDAREYLLNPCYAVSVLEQGAEDGNPFAQNRFATLLVEGKYTKQDHTRALRFLDSSRKKDRPLLHEIHRQAYPLLSTKALFYQRELLALGVTPLVCTEKKENLLHLAAQRGHFDLVATLFNRLEFDQLVSAKNKDGLLPFDVVTEEKGPHTRALRSVLSMTRHKRALLVLFALTDWVPREIAPLIAKHVAPPKQGEGDLNEPMLLLANSCRVW